MNKQKILFWFLISVLGIIGSGLSSAVILQEFQGGSGTLSGVYGYGNAYYYAQIFNISNSTSSTYCIANLSVKLYDTTTAGVKNITVSIRNSSGATYATSIPANTTINSTNVLRYVPQKATAAAAAADNATVFNFTVAAELYNNTLYWIVVNGTQNDTNTRNVDYENGASGLKELFTQNKESTWQDPTGSSDSSWYQLNGSFGNCTTPASSYFQIGAKNRYNGTALTNFSANVTYNGTTTTYTTTNGTIVTNIDTAYALYANVSIGSNESGGFFPNSTINHNTTTVLNGSLFQAQVNFTASEIFTGNAVTDFTIRETLQTNTSAPLYLNAGTYSVTFNKSNWYNKTYAFTVGALTNTTQNITDVYQFLANISFRDNITAALVSTFTANITGTLYTAENTTTNGSLYIPFVNDTNINLTVNASNYAISSVLANITSYLTNITVQAYPSPNIIDITILSEENGSVLSGYNITVTVTNLTSAYVNYTTTGYEYVENLGVDNYTVGVTASGFPLRNYGVSFGTSTEVVFLNAYLSANANSSTIITTRSAVTNAVIEGCTVSVQRIISGSWTTIHASVTDVTGTTYFNYVPLAQYRFIISCSGYETKTFILNPIVFSSYTVLMEVPTGTYTTAYDYGGVSIVFSPQIFYNGNNSFTIVFTSGEGTFTNYGFNLSFPVNSTADSGINAYGEQFTTSFNITGASIFDTVNLSVYYDTTFTDQKTFNYSFSIRSNTTTTGTFIRNATERYGLGYFEAALIVTIVTLLVAGAAAYYAGTIASGVVIVFMLGYFMYIGMIPLWAGILSLLTGFVIIAWRVGN